MSNPITKESASNEQTQSGDQGASSLQELAELSYSYCLQVLEQARIQFSFSLGLTSLVLGAELLWLFVNKSLTPGFALSLAFNPILAYSCYYAGKTLRRADEVSRLILAIRLAMLIDNQDVRNSTLSGLVKQLAADYSSPAGKEQRQKEPSELIIEVIEECQNSFERRFIERLEKLVSLPDSAKP